MYVIVSFLQAGIIEEMLEDTFEGMEEDDLEEAAQEEVDKVLFELTKGKIKLSAVDLSGCPLSYVFAKVWSVTLIEWVPQNIVAITRKDYSPVEEILMHKMWRISGTVCSQTTTSKMLRILVQKQECSVTVCPLNCHTEIIVLWKEEKAIFS